MNGLRFIRQSSHCRNASGSARRSTSEPGGQFGACSSSSTDSSTRNCRSFLWAPSMRRGNPGPLCWQGTLASYLRRTQSICASTWLRSTRDPVKDGLALGAPVGVLGIEPSTRRRNRISDRVSTVDEHGFTVEVVQSYGNCPQYNQSRALDFLRSAPLPHEIIRAHSSDTSRPARSPRTAPGRQQRSTRAAIQAKRHRNETAAAAKTTRRIAPLQVHTSS